MILLSRTASSLKICSCELPPGNVGSGMVHLRCIRGDCNSDKRLVYVHAMKLLSVCVEAGGVVLQEKLADAPFQRASANLQFAENAIAAENKLRRADFSMYPCKGLFQVLNQVNSLCHAKHQSVLDGAEESQAAIRIGFLDGTHVIRFLRTFGAGMNLQERVSGRKQG